MWTASPGSEGPLLRLSSKLRMEDRRDEESQILKPAKSILISKLLHNFIKLGLWKIKESAYLLSLWLRADPSRSIHSSYLIIHRGTVQWSLKYYVLLFQWNKLALMHLLTSPYDWNEMDVASGRPLSVLPFFKHAWNRIFLVFLKFFALTTFNPLAASQFHIHAMCPILNIKSLPNFYLAVCLLLY